MAEEKDVTALTAEQIRARRKYLADQRRARQLPVPEERGSLDEIEPEDVITKDIPLVRAEQLAEGIPTKAKPVTSETAPEAAGNIEVPDHGDETIVEPMVFPGATVAAEEETAPVASTAYLLGPAVIPTQVFPKAKTPEPKILPPAPQTETEPEPVATAATARNPALLLETGARRLFDMVPFDKYPRNRKTPVVRPDKNLVDATDQRGRYDEGGGDDGEELPDKHRPQQAGFRGPTPRYGRLTPPDPTDALRLRPRPEIEVKPNIPEPVAPATPPDPTPMDWVARNIAAENNRIAGERDPLTQIAGERDPLTQRGRMVPDLYDDDELPPHVNEIDYTQFEDPPQDYPNRPAQPNTAETVPPTARKFVELIQVVNRFGINAGTRFDGLDEKITSVQGAIETLDERVTGLNEKTNDLHDQIAALDGRIDTLMIGPRLAPNPERAAAPPPEDPFPRIKEGLDEVAGIVVRETDYQTTKIITEMLWRVAFMLIVTAAVLSVVFLYSHRSAINRVDNLEIYQLERDIALLQAIRGLPESCDQGSIEVKNGLIVKKDCQPMTSQLPAKLLEQLQARLDQLKAENRNQEPAKPVPDTYQRTEPAASPPEEKRQ